MKIAEILLEYKRDVTAKNLGYQLLIALTKDSGNLPHQLSPVRSGFKDDPVSHINQFMAIPETSKLIDTFINDILEYIESKDPTQNKQYTQWLARVYSKGGLKIEDMNRQNILGLYDVGKRRGMINPEHADINKFKSYRDFEDAIIPYDLSAKLWDSDNQKKVDKGKSKEVYKDANVRIILPKDEAAACYYGQGTRWCTTGGEFDNYNSRGPLYIMLPKTPKYTGEKYQLHFPSNQFMDEQDSPVDIEFLLNNRFPSTIDFFKKAVPEIKNSITFGSLEDIDSIWTELKKCFHRQLELSIGSEEEYNEEYIDYLKQNGYIDDDNNWIGQPNSGGLGIEDLDKEFGGWKKEITKKIDGMSTSDVKKFAIDKCAEGYGTCTISELKYLLTYLINMFDTDSGVIGRVSRALYEMAYTIDITEQNNKLELTGVKFFDHNRKIFYSRRAP